MKVYAHMLVWNDRRYLPDLFESIEAQTYKDFTLRVLDNGSTDETLTYLQEYYPHTIVARNTKNNGFAGGHNQLMQFTLDHMDDAAEDPFILIMNSDMILDPDVIKNLVAALDANPSLSAVQPKLYRAFAEQVGDEVLEETMKSDILDTTGMKVSRGWRMSDRGAGVLDTGQYDDKTDIFGATGTMALFRLSALQSVMDDHEIFDGVFFAYREDCDLVWRLRKAGWQAEFLPTAKAWHYRGMFGAEKQSLWQRLKNRRGQRPFFAALSTRNQLFVLIKNLTFIDFLTNLPWLVFGETSRVIYGFIFESQTRSRLLGMFKIIPSMLKKRSAIKKYTKAKGPEIRKYVRN
ncbi:MAG: glycosyltransferase family 2 protein [Patescibacteria group bacterium]